jgi:hypothetical protein
MVLRKGLGSVENTSAIFCLTRIAEYIMTTMFPSAEMAVMKWQTACQDTDRLVNMAQSGSEESFGNRWRSSTVGLGSIISCVTTAQQQLLMAR